MSSKSNSRNWNDVQTAIATASIVTTLGLWNHFAQPSKKIDSASLPPVEAAVAAPVVLPQVKIMFGQNALQSSTSSQPPQKNIKNTHRSTGGTVITQTRTS